MKNYKYCYLGISLGLTLCFSNQLIAYDSLKIKNTENNVKRSVLSSNFFQLDKLNAPDPHTREYIEKSKERASETLRVTIHDWEERGDLYEDKNRLQKQKSFLDFYDKKLTRIASKATLKGKSLKDIKKIFNDEDLRISRLLGEYRGFKRSIMALEHDAGLNPAFHVLKDISFQEFQGISRKDVIHVKKNKTSYYPLSRVNFYDESFIVDRVLNRAQKEAFIPLYSKISVILFAREWLRAAVLPVYFQHYLKKAQKVSHTPEQVEQFIEERMLEKIDRYLFKHDESYFEKKQEEVLSLAGK